MCRSGLCAQLCARLTYETAVLFASLCVDLCLHDGGMTRGRTERATEDVEKVSLSCTLSVSPFVSLPACESVNEAMCFAVRVCGCQFVWQSRVSARLQVFQSVSPAVCPSVCLLCLEVCPSEQRA